MLVVTETIYKCGTVCYSPGILVFAVLLTEIAERINLLYELKMTCKYTILQITAFRVVCFSLIGTVL